MRIAFASDNSYPWFNGGIEKRRFIIMHKLASQGHDVHCFTMHRPDMPGREFRFKGIRYHSVGEALSWQGMYRGGGKRRSIRMPLMFSFGLFLKIFHYRFDVLDADSFPFLHLVPLWLYTRVRGVRFAITWHEVWSKAFWKRYLTGVGVIGYFVEWLCARVGDVHIANVSTTKKLLEKELGVPARKIAVLPVAIDSDVMRSLAEKHRKKKRQFVVVSRLVHHKRVPLAISAIAKSDAKLIVVGIGPDLAELEEFAEQTAPGQVVFKHSLTDAQLYRLMQESLALIMPSEREGLSLITVEALALGLPVVIADTSSLPAEVKHMCVQVRERSIGLLLNKIVANRRAYEKRAARVMSSVLGKFSADGAQNVYERIQERKNF